MPCEASCGTRPWRTAGRLGRSHGAVGREAVEYFEQALSPLSHLPERRDTREQAIDLRLALRSALGPLSGAAGRYWLLREAEALAVALDDSRRLGQVLRFLSIVSLASVPMTRPLPLASVPSLSPRQVAMASRRRRRTTASASLPGPGGLSSGHRLLRADRGIPRGGAAPRALRRCAPASHSRQGQTRYVPCRVGDIRRGQDSWRRRAAGRRSGQSSGEPYHGLVGERLARPPPGPPAQGTLAAGTGHSICQDADIVFGFPAIAAALGEAYILDDARRRCAAADTGDEQTTAMATRWLQSLCRLPLGKAQMLVGRMEEAHALAERGAGARPCVPERSHQAYALRLLGEIAARRRPRRPRQPKSTTDRPSPWLRS